jgi:hypothetical protein
MNLKEFIEKHCKDCDYWTDPMEDICGLDEERGLKRMELCIRLLTSEGINP